MNKKGILLTIIFLIVSTGNYFRTIYDGSVRNVEFLSIFVIGALSGILVTEIVKVFSNRKKQQ